MLREIPAALGKYLKLSEGLAYFHRVPMDRSYRDTLRKFVENRENNLLGIARQVLANPENPYSQLFKLAGCSYSDLEAGVRRAGLEATLSALMREGVYLSLDEFRCQVPLLRGGKHIHATMADWSNAHGHGPLQSMSSGSSSGRAVRTSHSLEYANFGSHQLQLIGDEFLLDKNTAFVLVFPILPGSAGIATCLSMSRLDRPAERWFAMSSPTEGNAHYRMLTKAIATRLRLGGAKVPYPTYLPHDEFTPVAEYIARRKQEGARAAIGGMVSIISRVAAAAVDHSIDIRGTFAMVAGESLTDAKRRVIEAAGIDVFPSYGASDYGTIGMPCRHMKSGNCVHIASSGVALVERQIEDPLGDQKINSLLVTGLLPFSPRVLINVEIGDTGVIEPATCDCEYSRLGYDFQVRDIAAFSKICSQGVTLMAPALVRLLEEALPDKFGGIPGDYQLVEKEGLAQTEMVLRIHPRIGSTVGPERVLNYFLEQTRGLYGGTLAALQWTHTNGLRVEVKEPILAHSGKFRAIRVLGADVRNPEEVVPAVPSARAAHSSSA